MRPTRADGALPLSSSRGSTVGATLLVEVTVAPAAEVAMVALEALTAVVLEVADGGAANAAVTAGIGQTLFTASSAARAL